MGPAKGERMMMMMIGRNTGRGIATIVIGSFVWIIICPSVKGRGWTMCSLRAFVSLPIMFCEVGKRGNSDARMDVGNDDEVREGFG